MKKIVSLILMLAMLMGISAFAEEFTFHNGTKFGMTKEEVLAIENENGLEFALYDSNVFADSDGNIYKGKENTIAEYGTMAAGIPDSVISYVFDEEGKMSMGRYTFDLSECSFGHRNESELATAFSTIEQSLIKKYGDTEYTFDNQTEMNMPVFIYKNWPFTLKIEFMASNLHSKSNYGFTTEYIMMNYSQRLLTNDDGTGIYIEHGLYMVPFADYNSYKHVLSYKFVDADTINYLTFADDKALDDL